MNLKITILGSGRFGCDDGLANQSILIEYNNIGILVDCGATTVYQLKKFGIDFNRIDYVFLTHFHGDHTAGLPFLMTDIKTNPDIPIRNKPLFVIGKTNTQKNIENLSNAMQLNFEMEFVKYFDIIDETSKQYLPKGIGLEYFDMLHKDESIGFKFSFDNGKIIGITGDTRWIDNIYKIADGCDILFIECSMVDESSDAPHISFFSLRDNIDKLKSKQIRVMHTYRPVIDEVIKLNNPKLNTMTDGEIICL